jgi:di/tricarboxylate transporter
MNWEAWVTIVTVALMVVAMARNMAGPDTVLLGGLVLLMTVGAVAATDRLPTPADAVAGFGNEGLVTIALLYVVACGLRQTGAMTMIAQPLLGRPRSIYAAQLRLLTPVAALSAFLNNTPIVAMLIPAVTDWCKKVRLPASKLLIPLSYAAILGGTCSLIGTSTNLIVYGWLATHETAAHDALGMFTIAIVGLPAAVIGLIYIIAVSPRLLPDRDAPAGERDDARRYTVEMMVAEDSALAGQTIEQAGLRHLPGAYIVAIERDGERLVAVGPEQVLHGGDRLIFAGIVESVVDLQKIRGLAPATDQVFKLKDPRPDRELVEVVVSSSCALVGRSIREGRFRTNYNAAVIAVHRNGRRIHQKVGDIELEPGDTLLLETHPRFVDTYRNSPDFFLVSSVPGSRPLRHDRAWIALLILASLVGLVTTGCLSMVNAAFLAAGGMVLTGCCSGQEARAAVEWRVLLVIGAALGVGLALSKSQAAGSIADVMMDVCRQAGPWGVLLGVYLLTLLFAETIGHIGAAALMLPVAQSMQATLGVESFVPFAVTIMMAASATFATPISYQTNLMVYGAGGYRFGDYLRVGLPLNLLIMVVTVVVVQLTWAL